MKVKKVAVTAAVCAALLGSQGVMAEEQPIGAEGMGFAFDDAQVSSVEMSELSGVEMDETKGSKFSFGDWFWGNSAWQAIPAAVDYYVNNFIPSYSSPGMSDPYATGCYGTPTMC